ncbi:hypothetical protein RIF29_08800 [Crotalaria pallida]|uniref:MYND-type domain-containing protein n=1 Tax=Crotalaria pallida TaxID=3830 RepID=A0AAN9FR86_CROPI
MDTNAVEDTVNVIEDIRIDDDDDGEDTDYDDYDEEEPKLGFFFKPENLWSLCREHFPSKAGGVPAWLDPQNIPLGRSSLCDICGDPLRFLLQACLPIAISEFTAALCDWCGTWRGNKLCGGCRQVRYCSEKHQVMSWRSGHKTACKQIKVSSLESHKAGTGSNNAWPEFKIIIEDKSDYRGDIPENNTLPNSLISRNRIDDRTSSLLDGIQGDDYKSWDYFTERIREVPDQVLRYYRGINARPIWPVSRGRASRAVVPNCNYCGGPMCCEFQIMPQLLSFFKIDNGPDSLDWATIVVYACEASCEGSLPYKQEYAWVQLF